MDTRQRQNKLLIYGIDEDNSLTTWVHVGRFMLDYLDLDADDMKVEHCDRVGSMENFGQGRRKRPILVEFRCKDDVDKCIRKAYRLAGTNSAIDRD